jgi:hypothetical protein
MRRMGSVVALRDEPPREIAEKNKKWIRMAA